jgi:hypothetical protein
MNVDSFLEIGSSHPICQDYITTVSGNDWVGLIVCDGCSASKDVDTGARALALSAKQLLLESDGESLLSSPSYFGLRAVEIAYKIKNIFPNLDRYFLDSTLIISIIKHGISKTYIYGDGFFIHSRNGEVSSVKVDINNNAPDYLSYLLDDARMRNYLSLNGKKNITTWEPDDKLKFNFDSDVSLFTPVKIESNVVCGDLLAISSDGIGSFNLPWMDVALEISNIKSFQGVFLKRRMMAFKRNCIKQGISHYDDIGIAACII